MTAIGFALFVFGFAFFHLVNDPGSHRVSVLEKLGITIYLLGGIVAVAGITTWLWQVMP